MDVLTLFVRTVREAIQATGVPPDALQDALDDAESQLRRSMGGGLHHISRVPPIKAQVAKLAESGLGTAQISVQLGISDRHVRRVLQMLRRGG